MQCTAHLLVIRPVNFGYNADTAVNNVFQKISGENVQEKALKEFDDFVSLLVKNKLNVTVAEDSPQPATPDSIFPNNWISFHADGRVFLYPMFAPNRRLERKPAILDIIKKKFTVRETIDLSDFENNDLFLEGTGSMVLDREHKIAYACLSARTNKTVLQEFCRLSGYKAVTFNATDENGINIYHTNVMMCVGKGFAVVCLQSLRKETEKAALVHSLQNTGKTIIDISLQQLHCFAGNMLQVKNMNEELLLVMSTKAYQSLTAYQLAQIENYCRIIHASLTNIEMAGGGSARCMLAEIFLPIN